MKDYILLIELPLIILITYMIFKYNKFTKLKDLLYKLFWIDVLSDKSKYKSKFTYKFMNFGNKFFMYIYVFIICQWVLTSILTLNLLTLVYAVILVPIYPLSYRLVMWFQRIIHGIK